MLSSSCWYGVIEAVAPFFRWSGWSVKIPVDDDDDHCSAQLSEASDVDRITLSSPGYELVSNEPDSPGSDAIRAVLTYHLQDRRRKVRTALEAAVQSRNASEILNLYQEAEAVGVPQTEIDQALELAAKICAPSTYEIVMNGGSATDMIHCLGCVSHLSSEQIAQLEKRLAEEVFLLTRKGDWSCVYDLLHAAEIAGVSSLPDANGRKSVAMMIKETYADEAMKGTDADAISEACAALEEMSTDRDLSEMRARVQQIRAQTAYETCPDGGVLLGTKGKLGSRSVSSVSTAASDSLAVLADDTAAAC
jgi:hypothetical protein